MSILIKMEMPKNCAYCPCEHYECGLMGDEHNGVDVTAYFEGDKRHPDCPLIEVPPHGDLIDRKALSEDIEQSVVFSARSQKQNAEIRGAFKVYDRIKAAPTVIESEE